MNAPRCCGTVDWAGVSGGTGQPQVDHWRCNGCGQTFTTSAT